MRTELCVCGGWIHAPSLEASAPYVEAHGWTGLHRLWRARRESWLPGHLYRNPRRPTAVTATVTCPGTTGASGVEGAG